MIRDRILLSAFVVSVVWHLFWLSALTVVVVPKDTKPPKFSSVSFLGPILETSMLEVSSEVHERSIPEKRYLSEIEKVAVVTGESAASEVYTEAGLDIGIDIAAPDEIVMELAIASIDGNKMEPGNSQ